MRRSARPPCCAVCPERSTPDLLRASKRAFFEAALGAWVEELRERTEPNPELPPSEQLKASLEGFLSLVEENAVAET